MNTKTFFYISLKKSPFVLIYTDSDPPPVCRALGLTRTFVVSLNGEKIVSSV